MSLSLNNNCELFYRRVEIILWLLSQVIDVVISK